MTKELLPGARVPSIALADDKARPHIEMLRRALRAARLNAFYPDSRALSSHIEALSPDVHGGLYPTLEVDVRTGLPTYRDFTRVQTDVTLADGQLAQLGSRAELDAKARGGENEIWAKQLRKFDYYSQLEGRELHPLSQMRTTLRRADRATRTASFHVELDKLDASGVFVRYSIDLEQTGRVEGLSFDVDQRDMARQSAEFEGLIYKFTSLDAEFSFVKLATIGGLEPERITKGIIGPVWTEFTRTPPELESIVAGGGFVASFSLDSAAVDIAEQRNNDPFATLAQDRLTEESRRAYAAVQQRSGYRVFKDRKFVVPRAKVSAMRAILAELGTKNIVYGI